MPPLGSRRRSRATPSAKIGPQILGQFEYRELPHKPWVRDMLMMYNVPSEWSSWETTIDENHGRPPYKTGGPFEKVSVQYIPEPSGIQQQDVYTSRDQSYRYVGGFAANTGHMNPGWMIPPNADDLSKSSLVPNMAGSVAKAWRGAKPKIQQVNGFAALAELGEVPRMLGTTAKAFHDTWRHLGGDSRRNPSMTPHGVADNFLNHQFGWVPFLSDVGGAIQTYQKSNDIIARLTRNNGRGIRRRVTVENVTSTTTVATGTGSLFTGTTFPQMFYQPPNVAWEPTWEVSDTVTRRVEGIGKFRYYLPEFDAGRPDYDSAMNTAKRHLDIYGVRINPSNLYQIVPWSWAADWVSNVGHYVHKFSDEFGDNLAAEYFYTTFYQDTVRTYTNIHRFHDRTVVLTASKRVLVKKRVEGDSPFGVSLSWANLSPRQIAIAGALGISASPKR